MSGGKEQDQFENTLKVRDDHRPICFGPTKKINTFKRTPDSDASWVTGQEFGLNDLRNRVEPWLTSLFQSEHLSLLAGSGLTHAVHYLATSKAAAGMDAVKFSRYQDEIDGAAQDAAKGAGRAKGNLKTSCVLPTSYCVVCKSLALATKPKRWSRTSPGS